MDINDSEALVSLGDWTLATEALDRAGDTIDLANLSLESYRANPIFLWQHDSTKPIGVVNVFEPEAGALKGEPSIAADSSEHAKQALALVNSGVIKALSIGFRPLSMTPTETGYHYESAELCEISLVSVPANPQALRSKNNGQDIIFKSFTFENQDMQTSEDTTAEVEQKAATRSNMLAGAPNLHLQKHRYSLQQVALSLKNDKALKGLEGEADADLRSQMRWRDWGGIAVPTNALFPMKTKANHTLSGGAFESATGSQYLDSLLSAVDDAILDELLIDVAGVQSLSGLTESTALIPVETAKQSAAHYGIDDAVAATTGPATTNREMKPRKLATMAEMSYSTIFGLHPDVGDGYMSQRLTNAIIEEVNRVFVAGNSGSVAADVDGLIVKSTNSAVTVAPATAVANFDSIVETLVDYLNNANPAAKWIVSYKLLNKLKNQPAFSGAGESMYQALGLPGNLAGFPVIPTTVNGTTATEKGYFGNFSSIYHGLWSGIDLTMNQYADSVFGKNGWLIRAVMLHDLGFTDVKKIRRFEFDLS